RRPPEPPTFPYTTLFRSASTRRMPQPIRRRSGVRVLLDIAPTSGKGTGTGIPAGRLPRGRTAIGGGRRAEGPPDVSREGPPRASERKRTRLNSSHDQSSS